MALWEKPIPPSRARFDYRDMGTEGRRDPVVHVRQRVCGPGLSTLFESAHFRLGHS